MAYFNIKIMSDFFKRVGEYDEDKAKKIIHKYLMNDDLGKLLFAVEDNMVKEVSDQTEILITNMIKKMLLSVTVKL